MPGRRALSALLAGLLLAAVLAASCTVGPDYVTPGAKVAGQWMDNPAITNRPARPAEACWWRSLEDPVVDELIETANRDNPSRWRPRSR